MPSDRPVERFADIVRNIDAIAEYTSGMNEEAFLANRMAYDACERCLSRISEAAIKLGLLAEQLAPDQPWRGIRGLGNWLRHDYPNILEEAIWKTITQDLPALRVACSSAIAHLASGTPTPP